ncbi:hypothetical protein EXIGLDRAFT_770663 [Exidia glandulosa HHB12029]|uniref:Uncharacterized protein n=1 Tax=Exidia glandulosa HHB12029 TaxID=1314781 RepID=A0A166ACG2_EXIGL|nr:hypothetical protein EXIGLDRAFT_770663 [Exidia glandulosa HHB12029]
MSHLNARPQYITYSNTHPFPRRDSDTFTTLSGDTVIAHNTSDVKITRFSSNETLSSLQAGPRQSSKGFFPLSLVIVLGWVAYIALLLYLLEASILKGTNDRHVPWIYTDAPSLLLTLFAQGHAAITGMHLARIAISALSSPSASPNQWIQLLWLADRAWSTPVGVVRTCATALRKWIRPSATFFLFALTCGIAIATPTVLERAYPIRTTAVTYTTPIHLTTFDPKVMRFLDAYVQENLAMGSWETGQTMQQLYKSSVFVPDDAVTASDSSPLHDAPDLFFAGDIGDANVILPGIRFTGACTPVADSPSTVNASLRDAITPLCSSKFGDSMAQLSSATLEFGGLALDYALCTQLGLSGLRAESTSNEGYFLYTYNNTGNSDTGHGLVHCSSTFTAGTARLCGANQTFTGFEYKKLFDVEHIAQDSEHDPLQDPLGAAFDYLGTYASSALVSRFGALKGFGLSLIRVRVPRVLGPSVVGNVPETWTAPSQDEIARRLWSALAHNVAAIGSLSWSDTMQYNATESTFAAIRVRQSPSVAVAYALLGTWLVLIVILTAIGWRKTFASSLDSYVAAEFCRRAQAGVLSEGNIPHARGQPDVLDMTLKANPA